MPRKAFTVAEANVLVPVLEAAFERVRRAEREARACYEKLQVLDALWGEQVEEPRNPDHPEWAGHRSEIRAAVHQIKHIVQTEIIERGLRFPRGGIEHGLVDFPTTWQGRWVYLCWRCGEPSIEAWHEVSDGYRGRQPVTPEHERRMGRDDDPASLDDSALDF